LSLNQTAANDTGHATPPEQTQAKSLLCARLPDKVAARQCAISPLPTNGGNEYRSLIDPGPNIDGTSLVPDQRCDSRSLRSEQQPNAWLRTRECPDFRLGGRAGGPRAWEIFRKCTGFLSRIEEMPKQVAIQGWRSRGWLAFPNL